MDDQTAQDFEAWKAYANKRKDKERDMEKAAETMFDQMERAVLENIRRMMPQGD